MLNEIKIPVSKSDAISALNLLAGTREVEVELPILRTKARVTPILGGEELKLHTMRTSGKAFIKEFNKLLFNHCTFDGVQFEGVEDFERNLSPADKSMLVYALLDSTFTKLPEKVITCPSCGQVDNHSPKPSDIFHTDSIKKVWDHSEEFVDFEIESKIIPGLTVFYGIPTEEDSLKIIESKENSDLRNSVSENDNILNSLEVFSIYIKKIIIANPTKEDKENCIILTDKTSEIIPTIQDMPLDLKSKLLEDETINQFADYVPSFYLNINCSNLNCELKTFKWDNINPEQDFFRKALSVYN